MTEIISCFCGYRGPAVVEEGRTACPVCHGRVKSVEIDPTFDDGLPSRPRFRLPNEQAEEAVEDLEMNWPGAGGVATDAADLPDADALTDQPEGPTVYHIPCPKGHVLDVREELLGQQVVCPDCNTFFVLRATDSIEYRKEQARRRRHAEERRAESWLRIAIGAAVIIALSFIIMIVIALNPGVRRPP